MRKILAVLVVTCVALAAAVGWHIKQKSNKSEDVSDGPKATMSVIPEVEHDENADSGMDADETDYEELSDEETYSDQTGQQEIVLPNERILIVREGDSEPDPYTEKQPIDQDDPLNLRSLILTAYETEDSIKLRDAFFDYLHETDPKALDRYLNVYSFTMDGVDYIKLDIDDTSKYFEYRTEDEGYTFQPVIDFDFERMMELGEMGSNQD